MISRASCLKTVDNFRKHEALLVCPEFSAESYPSSRAYNCGNVLDESGALTPEERWTFAVIERVFDEVKARAGNASSTYLLYGHSAGAQFVHRMVLLMPRARVSRAVAANAGWYTMPSAETSFPYGMKDVPDASARLQSAFGKSLLVLLGEEDTDTDDQDLRQTPEAMAQGEHRLARGRSFLTAAEKEASRLEAKLAWKLVTVPGAHHSNAAMARAAAEALFSEAEAKSRR